ncbi:MAG: hypothetical protein RL757_182 [Bacteroidota bacterium]|jgi:hypothetical protein
MEQNQDHFEENLLNANVREEISDAARWAKLWAILSFITLSISLTKTFLEFSAVNDTRAHIEIFDLNSQWVLMLNVTLFLLSTTLYIFLYLFGRTAQMGIENRDNQELNGAFKWLYRHFMLQGVVIILAILSIFAVVIMVLNHSFT